VYFVTFINVIRLLVRFLIISTQSSAHVTDNSHLFETLAYIIQNSLLLFHIILRILHTYRAFDFSIAKITSR